MQKSSDTGNTCVFTDAVPDIMPGTPLRGMEGLSPVQEKIPCHSCASRVLRPMQMCTGTGCPFDSSALTRLVQGGTAGDGWVLRERIGTTCNNAFCKDSSMVTCSHRSVLTFVLERLVREERRLHPMQEPWTW
mmetsp:Transcript_1664/g.6327  ORF Transcript_1664/g.6327 Transcript_1664/m.6327 type:complete len:133 (+) Transcript_1664:360-758(+)